ncbi:MAG: hypothetical protein LQ349_006730 [Xanthoria aureola]|nr:MAG: hypothetical protein LQ349_006730 [Xanthoria aureola]
MHGGCVCIPSEYQRKNEIVGVINDIKVNWVDITPSFSNTFILQDVPSLRTIILAGEEVKMEQRMYRTRVVAEDNTDRLVSIAAVGELLVEGPTLAYRYLKDESRTREAFIESPLAIELIPLSTSNKVDRRQVDYLLAGLDADKTCIVPIGNQEQSEYLPLPPSDALAHEIGAKVVELLVSRNNYRLTSLIGYNFRLAALGFDSIQAITLRMWLKKRFTADIPVSKLSADTITISSLVGLINHPPKSVTTVKLFQKFEIMASELHVWRTKSAEKKQFEPTGHGIVDQLVGSSAIKKVSVLIRCSGLAEGYTRVAKAVGEAIERYPGRIEIWPGDLQETRYWKTHNSDANIIIIHNGPVIRWNADSLRDPQESQRDINNGNPSIIS